MNTPHHQATSAASISVASIQVQVQWIWSLCLVKAFSVAPHSEAEVTAVILYLIRGQNLLFHLPVTRFGIVYVSVCEPATVNQLLLSTTQLNAAHP